MITVSELNVPELDTVDISKGIGIDVLLAQKKIVSKREVKDAAKKIKPVVRVGKNLYYIEPVNPMKRPFNFRPQMTQVATDLTELERIHTLHKVVYYDSFRSTVAEVISMIPSDIIDKVRAFEVFGPRTMSEAIKQSDAITKGYHIGLTILYS